MTLEELKVKYQSLADTCDKKGDEYHDHAQDLTSNGLYEDASRYYDKANFEYIMSATYLMIVIDLRRIENK